MFLSCHYVYTISAWILLFVHVYSVQSKFIDGQISSYQDWQFINRFCFLSSAGTMDFTFELPRAYEIEKFLLYTDSYIQWPSVYQSSLTCAEKTSSPHIEESNGQVIELRSGGFACDATNSTVTCERQGIRVFAARERWWFLAASRCNPVSGSPVGMNLKYKITLLNGDGFRKHFSADEFYILEVDIAFLIAISGLLIMSIYVAVTLHSEQLFHTTFKLFMASIMFEWLGLIVMCAVYGQYSIDGVEQFGAKTFGRVLEAIGVIIFIIMLILMAKGFTITRGRISFSGSLKLVLFSVVYCVVYAVLFFYEADLFDPGLVLYVYESPPGYGLLAMRLVAWLWFSYGIFFTIKHHPKRATFYLPFYCMFTIWFWAGPCTIIISNFALMKWVRATVVNGVERFVTFCGLACFLFLTWPSRANKNFPYRIKTTQIGIINLSEAAADSDVSDEDASDDNNADDDDRGRESQFDDVVTFGMHAAATDSPPPLPRIGGHNVGWAYPADDLSTSTTDAQPETGSQSVTRRRPTDDTKTRVIAAAKETTRTTTLTEYSSSERGSNVVLRTTVAESTKSVICEDSKYDAMFGVYDSMKAEDDRKKSNAKANSGTAMIRGSSSSSAPPLALTQLSGTSAVSVQSSNFIATSSTAAAAATVATNQSSAAVRNSSTSNADRNEPSFGNNGQGATPPTTNKPPPAAAAAGGGGGQSTDPFCVTGFTASNSLRLSGDSGLGYDPFVVQKYPIGGGRLPSIDSAQETQVPTTSEQKKKKKKKRKHNQWPENATITEGETATGTASNPVNDDDVGRNDFT